MPSNRCKLQMSSPHPEGPGVPVALPLTDWKTYYGESCNSIQHW